jgi:hypothetical protein
MSKKTQTPDAATGKTAKVSLDFISSVCRDMVESGRPMGIAGINSKDGNRCSLGYAFWSKDGKNCIATTSFSGLDPHCELVEAWRRFVIDVLPRVFEDYWGYIPWIEADNADIIHRELNELSKKRAA